MSALERARELVLRHGWNATAYQILNPGIALWFSEGSDAVVGYVSRARTRVVAGSPVCSSERLPEVVDEFERAAAATGESVCYFGAEERLESLLAATGRWSAASLGAQPSWNPGSWNDILRRKPSLRAQLNRARNKQVRAERWPRTAEPPARDLARCLHEWLDTRGLPPLHFLVEPDTLSFLDDRILIVARRRSDIVGFLVASPVPARNGWLFEQIVRGADAPNGTAELLIDAAMREVAALGATYVTLGLSPLSRHSKFDSARMPRWLRVALLWTRAHGRRFYNFGGLDAFKSKFEPECWEEVVALADAPEFPPRAIWAIASAFTRGSPVTFLLRALWKSARQEFRWIRGRA